MIHNRKPPKILTAPDDMLTFEKAGNAMTRQRLDLSRHDETHVEKLGFAIDALNRWSTFVKSVEQIEGLIRRYEESAAPLLGGPHDE